MLPIATSTDFIKLPKCTPAVMCFKFFDKENLQSIIINDITWLFPCFPRSLYIYIYICKYTNMKKQEIDIIYSWIICQC